MQNEGQCEKEDNKADTNQECQIKNIIFVKSLKLPKTFSLCVTWNL